VSANNRMLSSTERITTSLPVPGRGFAGIHSGTMALSHF
jgi:hypothetical protein